MSVQTIYGEVDMNVYLTGRKLLKLNFLGNELNLTSETLFIKTAYCLSNNKNDFEKLFNSNLEGFELKSLDVE